MYLRLKNSILVAQPNNHIYTIVYIPITYFCYNGGLNYEGMPEEYKDKPMTVAFKDSKLDWRAVNKILGYDAFYQESTNPGEGNIGFQLSKHVFPTVCPDPSSSLDQYFANAIYIIEPKNERQPHKEDLFGLD